MKNWLKALFWGNNEVSPPEPQQIVKPRANKPKPYIKRTPINGNDTSPNPDSESRDS